MIISRTPLRISFAGGGTDLPSYYRREGGGAVTSAAIDRYVHVLVNEKFDRSIRVAYSRVENVEALGDLEHGLVREAMRLTGVTEALEIHTIADIPSEGTGLGSSSSLTVGLLNALYAYRGLLKGPAELAEAACKIEIDVLGGTLGKQDQYIAAFGGVRYFEFEPDETVRASPIPLSAGEREILSDHLSLFYTGATRSGQTILKSQDARADANRAALGRMKELARTTRDALLARDWASVGQALDEGWALKRTLADTISNSSIDSAYERAKRAGAWGGKVTGAGGGGFFLVVHPPERRAQIESALSTMRRVAVRVVPEGSHIHFVGR